MNVTIIGTGNMARGIGTRLVAGGTSVTLVGHEPGARSSPPSFRAQLRMAHRCGQGPPAARSTARLW